MVITQHEDMEIGKVMRDVNLDEKSSLTQVK